jgi:hypothetical protein
VTSHAGKDEFRTLRLCGISAIPGVGAVEVRVKGDGSRAAIVGTTSCGSPWACPTCAARVREKRRREVHELVSRGTAGGYRWAFVTATLRHQRGQGVAQQRRALEAAWRAITTGRAAQARRDSGCVVGTVRAAEFMLEGSSGPHGHIHALVLVAPNTTSAALSAAMDAMGSRWRTWAARHMDGLRPDDAHGWTWELARSGQAAADYVTKCLDGDGWTVAHELARSDAKKGRNGSVAPMELLTAALDDVEQTGDLARAFRFAEYARATRGMRAVVVSRSLTAALGKVSDKTDEELANEPETLDDWQTVAVIPLDTWLPLMRVVGVADVLDAAVHGGAPRLRELMRAALARPG